MADDSNPTPGYAEALGELDSILRELEGVDVDVDEFLEPVQGEFHFNNPRADPIR